jgi:hypothetical protein
MFPSIEIGRSVHLNGYPASQFIPDQALNTPATLDEFYRRAVAEIHDRGGLLSWNHPFGAEIGAPLSAAEQATKRRRVFDSMLSKGLYGADIIEVGYAVRGQVDTAAHLALWDTFSRRARPLTGNGVNDDHDAVAWGTLANGFSTGIWSGTTDHASLMAGLRSGRAFTAHTGRFRAAVLDLLVDGAVPMGSMTVSGAVSRRLEIQAANLPSNSRVALVAGPVDYTGRDPATTVLESIPASSFGSSAIVSRSIDTSRSCFVRTQVHDSTGGIIGVSNPVWLLREVPPGGIPAARAA